MVFAEVSGTETLLEQTSELLLAANRVALSFTITGLNIPNGTEVMLRWSDPDHSGNDHGLAIDARNRAETLAQSGDVFTMRQRLKKEVRNQNDQAE